MFRVIVIEVPEQTKLTVMVFKILIKLLKTWIQKNRVFIQNLTSDFCYFIKNDESVLFKMKRLERCSKEKL